MGFCMEINLGVHGALHKEAKERGARMQRGEGMQSAGPLGCRMEKNLWMHGILDGEELMNAWDVACRGCCMEKGVRNIAWIIIRGCSRWCMGRFEAEEWRDAAGWRVVRCRDVGPLGCCMERS